MEYAKRTGCASFIVGHVTKDGAIAGPRLLEHLVDTVLYFEGETSGEHRILRAYKNRFGSIDEICVFTMHDAGLREVANPSELFLGARTQRPSGSCVVASIVGSRPVLIEVQALVGETSYGMPRRLANNLDQQRLAMILAVLERRAGFALGTHDVYASVAGGLRIVEPAADLGIALAIASSFRNVAVPAHTAAFGELGLSGEVRAVTAAERREAEARKLGYAHWFLRRMQRISPRRLRLRLAKRPALFEIVPNLSEGRDPATIDAAVAAVEATGARLIDRSSDAVHHRSVLTVVGNATQVLEAGIALAGIALERIDLRGHRGVHPRIGALDVLPFVPLAGGSLDEAVALAHRAGAAIWARYRIPSFYYGAAARQAERRPLPAVRSNPQWPPRRRRRAAPRQRRRDRNRRPRAFDRVQR